MIRAIAFTALASLLATSVLSAAPQTRLEARLASTNSRASGKAKFEARGKRLLLSIEVEDVVRSGSVVATVGGKTYTIATNVFGRGDLNLDSRRGHVVPIVKSGDAVSVTSNGVKILSGTFAAK